MCWNQGPTYVTRAESFPVCEPVSNVVFSKERTIHIRMNKYLPITYYRNTLRVSVFKGDRSKRSFFSCAL